MSYGGVSIVITVGHLVTGKLSGERKMSDQNEHLSRLNLDGFTPNGLVSYVAILNDYLLMHLLFVYSVITTFQAFITNQTV